MLRTEPAETWALAWNWSLFYDFSITNIFILFLFIYILEFKHFKYLNIMLYNLD
jgi:hypothetical protein